MAPTLLLLLALTVTTPEPTQPPSDTAAVELVVFSDIECPFCARAHLTMEELRAHYGPKLTLRWLHHPLAFHPNAMPAAIAAEAARKQGQFDAYVSLALANQRALSQLDLEAYAKRLGLDMKRFHADLKDPAIAERIARDIQTASALSAHGVPTSFINGRRLRGAQPIEVFKEAIDAELELAGEASGPEFRAKRLKAEQPDLYGYLHEGKVPTKPEPQPEP